MTVTPELQRLYASAPAGEELFETLEISHPAFLATHYITNAALPFTAALETGEVVDFISLPFGAVLPAESASGTQDMSLVIDNVDREILEELERAATQPTTRISVVYRAYSSVDLSAPGSDPVSLSITEVSANLTSVQATAGRSDVLNKKFPAVLYTVATFPGLDR
jgi:hypothetical protein